MRASSWARLLLVSSALMGGAASARPPKEYQAPREMTPEELAAAKARSKSSINDYGKDVPLETKPFPWLMAGMLALAGLVTVPFAIRAYLGTSKEIAGGGPAGAKGRD